MLLSGGIWPAVGRQRQITGGLSTLMALMGENPQWVQNLGDAFLRSRRT